eukprot:CAMPEP_0175168660 /NCGR_PEP_ID=MMETSP0087-20121206/29090_1 /TAXON_ID=136419 /ORGANISM="Unknown Unknown, Strain D1" /LENGTH=265 /DNA_ID=CAMNT_0016458823 /DNA_START=32 /DNA_END=826 /DNA_ORIENTATION=-
MTGSSAAGAAALPGIRCAVLVPSLGLALKWCEDELLSQVKSSEPRLLSLSRQDRQLMSAGPVVAALSQLCPREDKEQTDTAAAAHDLDEGQVEVLARLQRYFEVRDVGVHTVLWRRAEPADFCVLLKNGQLTLQREMHVPAASTTSAGKQNSQDDDDDDNKEFSGGDHSRGLRRLTRQVKTAWKKRRCVLKLGGNAPGFATSQEQAETEVVEAGQWHGHIELLTHQSRRETAVVTRQARVYVLTSQALAQLRSEDPQATALLYSI